MDKKSKTYLEILIAEITDIITENKPERAIIEIENLIDLWKVENDLHPEKVIRCEVSK